jgi:hypothetical protein
MQRYAIGFEEDSNEFTIYDSVLRRLIGNGKGKALVLDSQDEALSIINIMSQRVGA